MNFCLGNLLTLKNARSSIDIESIVVLVWSQLIPFILMKNYSQKLTKWIHCFTKFWCVCMFRLNMILIGWLRLNTKLIGWLRLNMILIGWLRLNIELIGWPQRRSVHASNVFL